MINRKSNTVKNTLKCVLVLGIIAVVCVALLAVANKFLQVEIMLDRATSDMINSIAPTGLDDEKAFNERYIEMVDLSKGEYAIKSIDDFNEKGSNKKVRALYKSISYNHLYPSEFRLNNDSRERHSDNLHCIHKLSYHRD